MSMRTFPETINCGEKVHPKHDQPIDGGGRWNKRGEEA
jgi:hypothetical protein